MNTKHSNIMLVTISWPHVRWYTKAVSYPRDDFKPMTAFFIRIFHFFDLLESFSTTTHEINITTVPPTNTGSRISIPWGPLFFETLRPPLSVHHLPIPLTCRDTVPSRLTSFMDSPLRGRKTARSER